MYKNKTPPEAHLVQSLLHRRHSDVCREEHYTGMDLTRQNATKKSVVRMKILHCRKCLQNQHFQLMLKSKQSVTCFFWWWYWGLNTGPGMCWAYAKSTHSAMFPAFYLMLRYEFVKRRLIKIQTINISQKVPSDLLTLTPPSFSWKFFSVD